MQQKAWSSQEIEKLLGVKNNKATNTLEVGGNMEIDGNIIVNDAEHIVDKDGNPVISGGGNKVSLLVTDIDIDNNVIYINCDWNDTLKDGDAEIVIEINNFEYEGEEYPKIKAKVETFIYTYGNEKYMLTTTNNFKWVNFPLTYNALNVDNVRRKNSVTIEEGNQGDHFITVLLGVAVYQHSTPFAEMNTIIKNNLVIYVKQ